MPIADEDPAKNQQVLETAARGLEQGIRDLKLLLVVAALMFIAGVFNMHAWRDWPSAYFSDPVLSTYRDISSATISFQALHYALILVAIFAPVALLVRVRVAALEQFAADNRVVPAGNTSAWARAKGLRLPVGETLQRAVVMVGPMIAVPFAKLTEQPTFDGLKNLLGL